eukprot:TRINITY_DN32912_c0_g4_i1.p1 TRINITY_DN32912_c0_g4~~TRINITY_DN32912_c0_g4_i1.p1  ORF type:complete len:629 (-),score=182.20 TRINITY_DN32912_c0_g4_i1:147-2033(-)
MTARVCPWASWAEFRQVYDQITSKAAEDRVLGVRRIQTWRSRGRLPVAVDMTGSFVEIMLNDPEFNEESRAPRSEHELQLLYSMAVIRLVNGLVDVAQRGRVAKSVAEIAKDMDWPQWLVDIRHEATHMRLPYLTLLRLAAKEAVWLLLERFWRPQLEQVSKRRIVDLSQQSQEAAVGAGGPPRDRRFLARRYRRLVQCAATMAQRKAKASKAKEEAASKDTSAGEKQAETDEKRRQEKISTAEFEKAMQELIRLGADESRLLEGLLASMSKEPNEDGREAIAMHAVCARSSENLALRFARCMLGGALAWQSMAAPPSSTSDIAPSLRNVCDECEDEEPLAASQKAAAAAEADSDDDEPGGLCKAPGLALKWLAVLLRRSTPGSPSTTSFAGAVAALAPQLRKILIERMASAAVSRCSGREMVDRREEEALSAAGRLAPGVWRVLAEAGIDAEGRRLLGAFSLEDGDDKVSAAAAGAAEDDSGQTTGAAEPELANLKAAADSGDADLATEPVNVLVNAEEIEAMLSAVKKRRLTASFCSAAKKRRSPWTVVGTELDPRTLRVRCRRESGQLPIQWLRPRMLRKKAEGEQQLLERTCGQSRSRWHKLTRRPLVKQVPKLQRWWPRRLLQ